MLRLVPPLNDFLSSMFSRIHASKFYFAIDRRQNDGIRPFRCILHTKSFLLLNQNRQQTPLVSRLFYFMYILRVNLFLVLIFFFFQIYSNDLCSVQFWICSSIVCLFWNSWIFHNFDWSLYLLLVLHTYYIWFSNIVYWPAYIFRAANAVQHNLAFKNNRNNNCNPMINNHLVLNILSIWIWCDTKRRILPKSKYIFQIF